MAVAFPVYNAFVGIGVALAVVLYQRRLDAAFTERRHRERALLVLLAALPAAAIGAWAFDRFVGAAYGPILPLRGLAFYGGLLGALAAGIVTAVALGVPLLRMLDAAAPCIALGHAIGRLGCAAAGCCFGRHTRPGDAWHALGLTRIPTQWLESLALFVLTFLLLRFTGPKSPRTRRDGDAIALYFAAYGVVRFLGETVRDDVRGALPGLSRALSPSQWISVALLVAALLVAGSRARRSAPSSSPA